MTAIIYTRPNNIAALLLQPYVKADCKPKSISPFVPSRIQNHYNALKSRVFIIIIIIVEQHTTRAAAVENNLLYQLSLSTVLSTIDRSTSNFYFILFYNRFDALCSTHVDHYLKFYLRRKSNKKNSVHAPMATVLFEWKFIRE